ncbi:MAG TPA: hypothetical protein VIH42_12070 [Thermoguttaceae bacterium]
MNQADQILTKTLNIKNKPSSGDLWPMSNAMLEGGLSDTYNAQLPVMARIPDIYALGSSKESKFSSKSFTKKTQNSRGRLISAGLSLRLLMGLGLSLLLVAITPYLFIKFTDKNLAKIGSPDHSWQSSPPAPSADLAPAWQPETAQENSSAKSLVMAIDQTKPAQPTKYTMQSGANAAPTVSYTPDALKADKGVSAGNSGDKKVSPSIIKDDPETASSALCSPWPRQEDKKASFSAWPNPAHPILVETYPRSKVKSPAGSESSPDNSQLLPAITNRPITLDQAPPAKTANPTALRRTKQYDNQTTITRDNQQIKSYTVDRRNEPLPGGFARTVLPPSPAASGTVRAPSTDETNAAQLEGVIELPSDENIYDRSRPGIH